MRVIEEIFKSPPAKARSSKFLNDCVAHDEFVVASIDATVRVGLRLKGQASYRDSKEKKASASIPDGESRRRVVSFIGRSGAPGFLGLIYDEAADTLAHAFSNGFSDAVKNQVLYIGSDACSAKLFAALSSVFRT